MAAKNGRFRSTGFAWGRKRVELGISMRDLEKRSGVNKAILSLIENGRMVPTVDEFDAVTAVLYPGNGTAISESAAAIPPSSPTAHQP
jgi:transcriptional regulator with XRE-family HTH domain